MSESRPFTDHNRYLWASEYPNLAYAHGRKQCFSIELDDGKTYYVHIEGPAKKTNLNRTRRTIQHDLRLYTAKSFAAAPDGIYAWLDTDLGFFAAPVHNILEFGSRHVQIADRVGIKKVFMGGELEKTRNNIMYNFLSGSFMKDIQREYPEYDFKPDAIRLFTSMGLTPLFTDATVIVKEPTLADMHYYASLGYKLWLYETKDACESGHWSRRPNSRKTLIEGLERSMKKLNEYEADGLKALEDYKKASAALAELEAKPLNIPTNANNETRKRLMREADSALTNAKYKRDSAAQRAHIAYLSIKNVQQSIETWKSMLNPKLFELGNAAHGGHRGQRTTRRRRFVQPQTAK